MPKLLLSVCGVLLLLSGQVTLAAPARAQEAVLWTFLNATQSTFRSAPSNGASNRLTAVSEKQHPYPVGGGLQIDYSGSAGFNTAVSTGSIPEAPWERIVSITADVWVPAEVKIGRLGLGIQVDGPPASPLEVPVHLMAKRGGWNHMSWPVRPGQLRGAHTFGFVLDTDEVMAGPLLIGNLRGVTYEVTLDMSKPLSTFDPGLLFGANVAYYYPPSFYLDPTVSTLARNGGFSLIRIPGGLNSDVYHWNGNGVRKPDGSIDPGARNPDGTWRFDYSAWAPGFEVKGEGTAGDPIATNAPHFGQLNEYHHTPKVNVQTLANWTKSLGGNSQLVVDVNVGSGSPLVATGPGYRLQERDVAAGAREAAEWVKYYNQKLGLGVKYWEVGNELNPFGAEMGAHIRDSSPQGWHWITAEDYAVIFRAYAKAMKAVDPAIKMAGPVGYVYAFADSSYTGNWLQAFLRLAGDVVDVVDLHFYESGRTEAEYLAAPSNLPTHIEQVRAWIREYAGGRAEQIGISISEWGNYNNTYPIADGLYSADLMGHMARAGLAFGAAWDLDNIMPNAGTVVPTFGFDAAAHNSGGWEAEPGIGWTIEPAFTRPRSTSMVVDYRGSTGENTNLTLTLPRRAIDWSALDTIRADVFIPQANGNNAITFWLRLENADGSIDDSYRDQPQATIWGQWNRLHFPVDKAKFGQARRIGIVAASPIPMATPLYFSVLETAKTLRQPNGRYWASWLFKHHFGTTLLAVDDGDVSPDRLATYASKAADGSIYLMVINKDPKSDVTAPIHIVGGSVAGQAEATTWSAEQFVWDAQQGVASKITPPATRVVGAGQHFTYTFPRYSITSLHLFPR